MEFSVFSSYGQLEYSSDVADAEKIYESIRASYIDPKTGIAAIDLTPGSYHEAKIYARAMAIADANAATRRAGNQGEPLKATESIPHFEADLRLPAGPADTLEARRAAVAARLVSSRGPRRESIYDVLSTILGSALVNVRSVATDEATQWPPSPAAGPGVFTRPDQPAKVIRLVDPVAKLSSPTTITYENWDTSAAPLQLAKGDVLAVQPENLGLAEKVAITSVSGTGATRELTATFTKAHDTGASASTGPVPIWSSNVGHLLIVVTHAAAINASLVDRVNDAMTRLVKGGTTWSIVQATTDGAPTMGPYTLGVSPLGTVPVGAISVIHTDPPYFVASPAGATTAGGTLITLYGRHLTSATSVLVDGVSVAFAVLSDLRITLTTAAHASGAVNITVTTPFGTASSPFVFT